MKKLYLLPICLLAVASIPVHAQSDIYSQSISQPGVNLRGGVIVLGTVNATFTASGYVVVHFDGECYAEIGDRIVVAASDNADWGANDGNVSIENSKAGFGRPFSHTRVYAVTAGAHTYYAVGQNAVETDGSGVATIYGNLTVEYYPDSGTSIVKSSGFVFQGDVTNTTVVKDQTIHVNSAGKILVRFDGYITSSPADRIVLAASNTMNWSFNDGNVAVEAVNAGDVDENSFSHTRVYDVNDAGDYTYNALAQVYGKAGGNHMIAVYGNLLVEFFPTSGSERILLSGFTLPTIDLNGQATPLTTISLDAPSAGKVMVVLDGYFTADPGYDIVLAASNDGGYTEGDGSITLQALDLDQNRYSFSHTRVYNINAGNHTFYAVGEIFGGSGSKTADLFGELTLRYIPSGASAVTDLAAEKNAFDLYPNPASDQVEINFKNPLDYKMKIEVLDLNGKSLQEYPVHASEDMHLDLSSLPAGLYWIKAGDVIKSVVKI